MKSNRLYYAFAFLFYMLCMSIYVIVNYQNAKQTMLSEIDAKLIQSALRIPTVLPANFHHAGMGKNDVSIQQDMDNIKRLSVQAKLSGVEYIYSCIKQGDDVVFTSSSATDKELKNNENLSYYFDVYDDASEELRAAFVNKKMVFEEYTDKWGHLRSVFIPQVSNDGTFYLVGADVKIDFIQDRLNEILKKSLIEITFFIVILIPLFAAYYNDNSRIKNILKLKVKRRTKQLKALLDHADQGFLSFSKNMSVHSEYSEKCNVLFAKEVAGEHIADLLFGENEKQKWTFIENIQPLFGDKDELRVETILSLLPNEVTLNKKIITVEYRRIGKETFMLILTDVTENKALEKSVEIEKSKLQMVVSAVGNSSELFELLDEYSQFMRTRLEWVKKEEIAVDNITDIYREIHTYKGLFAQKDFIMTPLGLHKLEEKLSMLLEENPPSNEALLNLLEKVELENWLERDLSILKRVLGETFFDQKTRDFFETKSLFEKLSSYGKLVEKLAQKLDKHLYPLQITCDKDIVLDDAHKPFIKSLVHLFRNCVDHGIEMSEERMMMGKDEIGTISCSVAVGEDGWEICIHDDGRGINTDQVANIAISKGILTQDEVDAMSSEEINSLIFSDNFSTKEAITNLSGRGVGLSALKYELEAVGGTLNITSVEGEGVSFTFFIPNAQQKGEKTLHECQAILTQIAVRSCSFLNEDMGFECVSKEFDILTVSKLPAYPYMVEIKISGSVNYKFIMSFEANALEEVAKFFIVDAQGEGAYEFMKEQVACEVANTVLGNAITQFPNKGEGIVITPPYMIGINNAQIKNKGATICTTEIKTASGIVMLALLAKM